MVELDTAVQDEFKEFTLVKLMAVVGSRWQSLAVASLSKALGQTCSENYHWPFSGNLWVGVRPPVGIVALEFRLRCSPLTW